MIKKWKNMDQISCTNAGCINLRFGTHAQIDIFCGHLTWSQHIFYHPCYMYDSTHSRSQILCWLRPCAPNQTFAVYARYEFVQHYCTGSFSNEPKITEIVCKKIVTYIVLGQRYNLICSFCEIARPECRVRDLRISRTCLETNEWNATLRMFVAS